MEKYDVYKDIAERTGGEIFVGVVGPVRTGKSTFISKFMENFVIPNMNNKLQRSIATDEMPQSADGKAVMTTQPKFIPANAVKVHFKNKISANVRLVDCVGYLIDGAYSAEDGDRMVKTPWSDVEIPFSKAAEIGTKKVIDEYSTIGVLVTSDGSFGEYKREDYVPAEEKTVKDLKNGKKPFVIVLNSANPKSKETEVLCGKLEEKYKVAVVPVSCADLKPEDISAVMEKVLLEFPVCGFNVEIPEWMRALPADSEYIEEIANELKSASLGMEKMRDFTCLDSCFSESENYNG
ncbi:MAG: stage IV sporulation protein A, partial [Clostridia bacterium]|nr:stage IV sporulation protein A [Clostridia bacterium]